MSDWPDEEETIEMYSTLLPLTEGRDVDIEGENFRELFNKVIEIYDVFETYKPSEGMYAYYRLNGRNMVNRLGVVLKALAPDVEQGISSAMAKCTLVMLNNVLMGVRDTRNYTKSRDEAHFFYDLYRMTVTKEPQNATYILTPKHVYNFVKNRDVKEGGNDPVEYIYGTILIEELQVKLQRQMKERGYNLTMKQVRDLLKEQMKDKVQRWLYGSEQRPVKYAAKRK